MQKILIIFAHPATHKSKINIELIKAVEPLKGVVINNLYENYPDFFIDIKHEQQLLVDNDIIVWHHPLYWFSCPALLKEWLDLVLEHGFAYGRKGNALKGKSVFNAISTGGSSDIYTSTGKNHFTIPQFLIPFHQTAVLCGMNYLPPFVVHGAHLLNNRGIILYAQKYRKIITALRDEKFNNRLNSVNYLNELL